MERITRIKYTKSTVEGFPVLLTPELVANDRIVRGMIYPLNNNFWVVHAKKDGLTTTLDKGSEDTLALSKKKVKEMMKIYGVNFNDEVRSKKIKGLAGGTDAVGVGAVHSTNETGTSGEG